MKNLKENYPMLICLITVMALTDNIPFIALKFILELAFMGGLWVIITAIDYIKDKKEKTNERNN